MAPLRTLSCLFLLASGTAIPQTISGGSAPRGKFVRRDYSHWGTLFFSTDQTAKRSAPLTAEITGLTLVDTSPTQAMFSYNAPDAAHPCKLEVRENSSYSPLVNDVNPTLFEGSYSGNRAGNL